MRPRQDSAESHLSGEHDYSDPLATVVRSLRPNSSRLPAAAYGQPLVTPWPVISKAGGELGTTGPERGDLHMRMIRWRVRRSGVLLAVAALVAGSGLLATAAFSAAPTDQTSGCAPDTTVQTTNGPVCGIVVGGVREWLGIPYAAHRLVTCGGRLHSHQHRGAAPCKPPPSATHASRDDPTCSRAKIASSSTSGSPREAITFR